MRTQDDVIEDILRLPKQQGDKDDNRLRELVSERLRLEEGVVDYPYDDKNGVKVSAPQGTITWGVGFTWPMGEEAISAVLDLKITEHGRELAVLLKSWEIQWWSLPTPVYAALLDVCFNIGRPRLSGFKKTLGYLKQQRWSSAAAELLDSRYARQVPARAGRNARLIRAGGEK